MKLKVKFCGMREKNNIKELAELWPDYMGFIYYPGSPRFVGKDFDITWFNYNIKKVGVFVNQSAEEIYGFVNRDNLDVVQLHGNETPDFCKLLMESLSGIEIWKAFHVSESIDFPEIYKYKDYVSKYLFDTKTDGHSDASGGTGASFNWNLLNDYDGHKKLIMAGGIGIHNIQQVCDLSKSLNYLEAADVNSKIETAPGRKSVESARDLIQLIRSIN